MIKNNHIRAYNMFRVERFHVSEQVFEGREKRTL